MTQQKNAYSKPLNDMYLRPDVSHKTMSKPPSFPLFTACDRTIRETLQDDKLASTV